MPYRGFDYLSLFSDPIDLAHGARENKIAIFNRVVDTKSSIIKTGPTILKFV